MGSFESVVKYFISSNTKNSGGLQDALLHTKFSLKANGMQTRTRKILLLLPVDIVSVIMHRECKCCVNGAGLLVSC